MNQRLINKKCAKRGCRRAEYRGSQEGTIQVLGHCPGKSRTVGKFNINQDYYGAPMHLVPMP